VELKPGGYHLMFLDMKGALKQGDTEPVTLTFAKAGSVTVPFPVQGVGAGAPHM
jgi:copper(I)-binding protein